MIRTLPLGLKEALRMTLSSVHPLPTVQVALLDALNLALSGDVLARVDSPSIDASLKDGYAVIARAVEGARRENPVHLKLTDVVSAGDSREVQVVPNATVRILTGAKIPTGANAVVAEEHTAAEKDRIAFFIDAEPGRNILPKGTDVTAGKVVARQGTVLTPGLVGMLAAAGHQQVTVVRRPKVAIISTGNEVVAPGQPLPEGKLYASNMTTLGGWCRRYRMQTCLDVVKDEPDELYRTLGKCIDSADAVLTSGGAWTSDRDLVAEIFDRLGWKQMFHRIRIGPGKAVGFGMLKGKPVFILPGGPPSNLTGFLQIALPGLLKLAGHRMTGLPTTNVRLSSELRGRYADWTQFRYGILEPGSDVPVFHYLKDKSRLRSMAEAQAAVAIPEGEVALPPGSIVGAQLLI
jgi:molybdopterin molybdotransferase